VVATMKQGEVSQALRTLTGFVIVKVLDTKPSEIATLPEVRDNLVQTLRQRKFQDLQAAYVNGMLDRGGLTINEAALRKAVELGK